MKKSDPKIIFNFKMENSEFEEMEANDDSI